MNKNNVIFILFIATLVGSTWGAIVNRQKIDLEHQLTDARTRLQKLGGQPLIAAAGQGKDEGELAALRKQTQSLEAKLSASSAAAIHALTREKETLAQQLSSVHPSETTVQEKTAGTAPNAGCEGAAGDEVLQQRLDEANAQLLGLEKIVDEKNAAMREAAVEKERRQINMDVLLGKIVDQQRALQTLQEENREVIKQLAARNEMAEPQGAQPGKQ
ncbi:MAG: hypothetical protein ACYC9M_00035 [Desulfobulbaceae bacterium]